MSGQTSSPFTARAACGGEGRLQGARPAPGQEAARGPAVPWPTGTRRSCRKPRLGLEKLLAGALGAEKSVPGVPEHRVRPRSDWSPCKRVLSTGRWERPGGFLLRVFRASRERELTCSAENIADGENTT